MVARGGPEPPTRGSSESEALGSGFVRPLPRLHGVGQRCAFDEWSPAGLGPAPGTAMQLFQQHLGLSASGGEGSVDARLMLRTRIRTVRDTTGVVPERPAAAVRVGPALAWLLVFLGLQDRAIALRSTEPGTPLGAVAAHVDSFRRVIRRHPASPRGPRGARPPPERDLRQRVAECGRRSGVLAGGDERGTVGQDPFAGGGTMRRHPEAAGEQWMPGRDVLLGRRRRHFRKAQPVGYYLCVPTRSVPSRESSCRSLDVRPVRVDDREKKDAA